MLRKRNPQEQLQGSDFATQKQQESTMRKLEPIGSSQLRKKEPSDVVSVQVSSIEPSMGSTVGAESRFIKTNENYMKVDGIKQGNELNREFCRSVLPEGRWLRTHLETKGAKAQYALNHEGQVVLSYVNDSSFSSSRVQIIAGPPGEQIPTCTMVSNFFGSKFTLLDPNPFCNIYYNEGKYRAMEVFWLKDRKKPISELANYGKEGDSLRRLFPTNTQHISRFATEQPNQKNQLSFNVGKVIPSVKNTILLNQGQRECFKLYKIGDNSYNIDITHPMSLEIGYALFVSGVMFKWKSQ